MACMEPNNVKPKETRDVYQSVVGMFILNGIYLSFVD